MGLGKQEAKISPFTLLAELGSGSHVLLQHLDVYQLQTGRTPCKILEMSQKHFQSSEKKNNKNDTFRRYLPHNCVIKNLEKQ